MRDKISFRVWRIGDSYMAMATDGVYTVVNCYGSTPEMAKEMARVRLLNTKNPDVS